MAERPLYTLYKNLKAQNYDVPDDYNKFESALTRDGKSGADNRHTIYENLKAQNFDVPDTYERFYTALFEPRSKTSSRAKGGSVPMSAADRARFMSGAAAISARAKQIANNAGRYNRLKQRKQKDFGRVNLGTHLTPFGGDANNVVKDEFAYNPETGKAGVYVTSDNENAYTRSDAEQRQAILDKYGEEWNKAVDMGIVPSELDKADPDMSDTDVAMRQMERRQEWLDENQNRRSNELNESMHLQDSPFVASGGAVAPSSFNAAIGNEANRLSDAEYGAYNTAKAYNQMLRTTLLQELKEQKQRNENAGWWKDKWNDVSNYFGAMFNTMLDPKLYSQGVMDAAVASNLLQVKKGMEDGTIKKGSNAGNAAQVMLSSIQQQQGEAAKQQQYGTKAYQYGDVSGRSLKFMADFALSGWRNVMTTGFTKAGEKVGEKMALGTFGKWFTKNTGRMLGDMAGSAALAATNQLGSTYNNVIERYVGMNNENGGVTQDKNGDLKFNEGVSLGKAIKDGFGSATIENFSEMFGEYLPGASKLLSKLGLSKVSSFFEKIGNNAYYKWLSNATNKSGIQGVMSEIAEEEFGTALHAAWGDGDGSWSDFNVFTNPDAREKQIDTCLGMFYSVGFMQAPRTAVGAINAVQYFNIKHQVNKADKFGQMMFGENWDEIKNKIDVTTNADLTKTVLDATRSDSMTAKQKGAVINYAMFLSKLRGFNQASDAKTKDKVEEGETAPTLSNDLDDAYTEGHNADDADKHDIQIQHEDQSKTLAAALNISEQQLSGMSDEELESLTGKDDKLDQAIYDYQLSSARYQGVVDDAKDKVDLAAHQAEQRVNMYTDKSRGSVRNATIKASGGAEDYGVYIISGNIATHDDGSIDVSNSDDMILYFDPTTNSVEHADASMFAELGEELPADEVKAQSVADAKENAIKEVAGIIDGTVDVGSQFSVTDADGTEHTYEVLADNGDGTAMITIDGNVPTELVKGENVQIPYSFEDLQQMKDLEDKKRLEAAKAEREQMEKERDAQQTEQTQPSFDFNQILNDDGNVVLVDVLDEDGNTKYPDSKLFLIRDTGAKAKVVELKSDGTIVSHAVNKEDVRATQPMSLDEYKQAFSASSMIEDNSGENRGEIEEEAPTIEGETTAPAVETATSESSKDFSTEQTRNAEQTPDTPAITLEDGTIVPMLEDGNPDFSKLTAAQTAELYDTQFDEDAEGIVSGYVSDAKKALDKANNMTVKGKTFVEQKASKDAKEKAIADAQAAYDSAIAIRDAYNERQLAKEENTPEGRKSLIEKARRKYVRLKNSEEWSKRTGDLWNETVGKLLHRLYDATGIDVFDDTPNTVYEYVAANVGPYSLNYEGNDNSKGVQQETGLSRSDFAKLGWLAAEGKGMTIDEKVHRLWENRPSNLESADTQDIRNALISLITSGQTAFQARDYIMNQRIELAESALEEQLRQEEDAAEAQRAKEEEEKKKAELEKKKAEEEKTNENRNALELSNEQQKAMEDGEKLGFPAFDNEGEPINKNVIELANWAKEQGLEIDPTSKLNSYADLFLMCKDDFGVSTLVPDVGEDINQVFYFPDNVQGEQLLKLQEEFNVGRDLKRSADMNSELTEGVMFYDGDTAREFKEFVDKKVEEQNKVLGEQRPEEDLPFSAKDNVQQQTPSERAADVEKNKVNDMNVVDNIVGKKTRKAFDRLAKMMGAEIQWQYSDKLGNGWIQETTDADGNVHRTIFITLDSSIIEGAQFIFGHEMTHQIKNLNPAAYNELTQLVLDTYGSDAFDKAVDETTKRYSDAGFSGRDRDYYAEEVVADAVGEMIRDLNLAHTLAMKMSHPLLAAIHEVLQKIKLAFYGTEYSDVTKNIIRSIEQAYVKTANGQVTNSETGEDVSFSLRQKPEPKKKGVGYKVFVLKDGKLYPPMVANPDGAATPVGVWLDADAAPIAGESKTGRPQVKQGGKGTQGGSGKLAYRPGWHLGVVPYAIQFNRKDAYGNKTLFPKNFVFAEVEYAADVDYQEEARQEGINPSGKYQHSLAGLKHLPTDGYYMYRTNPNPDTDPWVITGAMKVNRILTRAEQAELVKNAGREPQKIQEGDIVTDDVVNSINQEIADAPKFSLKVYHGSGADFTEFDFDHMGEGAGSQVFGWGGYVTSSKKIGKSYAGLTIKNRFPSEYDTAQKQYTLSHVQTFILEGSDKNEAIQKVKGLYNESLDKIEHEHPENNYAISNLKERIETLDEMEKGKLPIPTMSLYEVDIPDDNGSNYLDWENPLNEEQINAIRDALAKNGVDVSSWENRGFKLDLPFKDVYTAVLPMMMRCEPKEVSKFLSSLGYTGIKYPAGTIMGGAEENDTNYVIFKPEDMKITQHTKFSIKTYHGSQASFDKFDHSFMGSGEGAQAYGWGTYVSEVEGIAKAYAKQNASFGRISKISKYLGTGKSVANAMLNPSTHKKTLLRLIDNAIRTNEAIQNSTTFEPMMEESKKALSELKTAKEMLEGKTARNLYSVEIPDDTGDNYLGWDEPLNAKQIGMWKKALLSVVPESDRAYYEEWADGMLENRKKENNPLTGKDAYYAVDSKYASKKTSMALSKAGFVGVKVIAQRNTGGNKEGNMNYVIFDENNAQITNHTKFSLRLKSAIEETETNPSDAQKESGNYKKGHIKFGDYDYTIENPKGSVRSGKDVDGKEWKITMHDTYGYIRGKFGKDGDHLDMFINDKADLDNWNGDVFVVDQVNPDGSFDEHKVMYGYDSMDDAEKAYLANYSKGWKGLGNITGASKDEFDKWLDTSNRKIKPFADYAKVKFSQAQSVDNDEPKTFEDFLNHPSLKFSIKNEEQRKAAENAYEYASQLRPNKYAQYAIVDMSKPSKIPEYYEKKVLADNWRRFYNRAVRWGNYKLFDLDRPFVDQVNEVKGKVPKDFGAPDTATNKDNIKGLDRQVSYAAEPRYSLKDEKTLAGVHNITEEKLRKALKLGGLANPSLAVIDTNKSAHDNFGEISFIAPSALVDKRTGKTAGTWITDAYTQRYPSVERQMSEKGSQKFKDWVDSLEYPAADKAEIKRQAEEALSNNNSPAWELMYLKEKGIDIKEYNSKVDYRWKEIIRDHPTAEDILSSMQNDPELNEKVISLVKHTIIHPTWEKVSLEVRRKIYEETGNKVSPINPQVRKQTKEIFERDYKSTLLNKDGSPRKKDVKKVVEDIVKEHNDTKKHDFYLSKVKASDYVNKNGLYDDYIRWQEKKLDEFGTKNRIFRGYKPDGTRKYVPETLENVSKAMREEAGGQTNGSEYTSFGSFIAKIASRVDSTDEMRANKDKLSSNEDKEEFYEKWSDVYYDLAKFLYNDVFYGEQRLHDVVLQSDPKKYAKKEYGITLTPTFMKKLDALKNAVRTELKSEYFETKYNRPLRLNEFAAAVVPDNLGEDVRKGIENAGLPMYNYDPNKEGDRNRAFNEAVNSSDNIRFSLRYDQFEHDLNQWKKDNNLSKDAQRPTIPQRNVGESAVDFLKRVDEYRKQMALWKTAPTYEQHLLSDDTALGEFNRELQRGSVLKRIAFQDSMLAIRKAQEAIMKEVGVDRLNMAEDAYTAENRSHGKGKNEFEEYNNEFLQPLRKAYHQMKKVLGDSYDNVRLYMMAKHGLERNAQMAFKKSLEADYEDVAQRSAAYKAYKGDINRMDNDSGFELGLIDYATWVRTDNSIKMKYSPSYMKYRYDKMGIAFDYSGLSALFDGSDFEEAAHKLVRDIESKHIVETKELWDATNAATKKILRDGYKAGMMSKDTYQYVRDMYSHYIPLRGWDGTTADQVWDYVGGGKGAFNQTLKTAHGRTSIADDPIAYIENMAESGILLNNKNWVKQHLMLLAQNHPTSLLTLSKAWYVKSTDANGNEEWIPATPQITSQMNSNQVKAAIDAFEQKMEQMEQTGDATQKRDGLNIAYPQTHSEEREHEVRVMKDGEEYVIYVNGDPQLAQAMNNTRAHRVREIQSGKIDRAAAWLGRKMAAAYTSLSPLFIPSNYFRDLTMTLASTAIREDAKYNYLLRKNLATSWNLGFMLRDYQNGKLREKVRNGNATPKEQMFYDFMMNGGETGFVSSLDVEDLKKKFKNDLKDLDRWKANPVKVGHTIMDIIEFLNRVIEDSNRFAVYMTSIQYGRSIDEAVNDAKNVTLNFNRKGTGEYGWQMIRNLYLFINPAVQSLQTLGALAKHHPYKFTAVTASWLVSGVLVPIVNAALMQMAAAFGGDGDDDKEWYKDISKKYWQFTKWDRRNNFIMWFPTTHEFVKIPLAQEFRSFYGLGDMIASKMMGGELAEESWSQYAEDLLGQVVDMLPLDPTGYDGNIAVSMMPNAIRPVFELAFNVDFTGKPLFKDTEYNKYDPNFTKAYVGTPDWLVRASRMMNSIGNDYPDVQQNSIDAFGDPRYNLNNPAVVDHVLSSYLGGAYTMGSQVLGLLTKSLNDPKEIKVADIPLFSKFVSNPDDRPVTKKQGDEFWNMKENHDRAANTLSKLKKQAKVDGDYSMLERFYGSDEYKQYKQDDVKVKKYEEDKKKERAEESGEEYRPHKLNAEDIYKAHATPNDDFEDLKLEQLYNKLNGFKSTYDLLFDTAPGQSDVYYNANKDAIDAINDISLEKQKISELKKGFLYDGKDSYNAEDMKRIRELRKKVLAVLEKANKVVVANQKANAKKK